MPLLCLVWGQARLHLQTSYLPLTFSSLKIINHLQTDWVCLGQGEKCYWSAFCRAFACSWWEPALPAYTTSNQPHSSLQAHFWAGALVQALDLRVCHQDSSPAVLPLHGIHFQCGQEEARRMPGKRQANGESHTATAGLSSNPSTFRGKVRCFFTPGFPQEWRQWCVGTTSLLDTNEGNWANLNKQIEAWREEKLHLLDMLLFFTCAFDTYMLLQ